MPESVYFPLSQSPSKKGSTLKGKNLFPQGENFELFE